MIDIARFLGLHAPFSGLEAEALERVAARVEVEFYTPGTVVIDQGEAPSQHVYVIRRGAMELVDGDRVVDVLEEGDLFGFSSMLSGNPPIHAVRARDETLCYLIPDSEARSVFSGPSGMRFLTLALRHRSPGTDDDMSVEWETLGDLTLGSLVTVDATTAIVETAKRLTEARATAAVVVDGDAIGIVTDRDIRAKVVAAGVPVDSPTGQIATPTARTARTDERVETAIVRMLEMGIHHLPLVDDDGAVVGMVTDLDLMAQRRRQSFRLRSEIERADDVATLAAAAHRIPETLLPMIRAGVDVDHLDVMIATLFDGVTDRLVEMGKRELGPPPVPFAWIALGASGRREQGLRSTQDHAIVYGSDNDHHDPWFERLAQQVTEGLTQAGFAPSQTGILATDPAWRGPETWWREQIGRWISASRKTEASVVAAAFDGRVVSGHLNVGSLFRDAVARAAESGDFLGLLRDSIIGSEIPLGFHGDKVTSGEGVSLQLDVDKAGIRPIVDMARLFSLSAGVRSVGTVRRLREAAAAGAVDPEVAEGLEEALEMLRELRVRHQARQWERRREPDTLIEADELGPLERRALRDAFRLVRDVQRSLQGSVT